MQRIDGMLGTLMACGDVTPGPDNRTFFVKVRRERTLTYFKETLLGWDRWGFVRWSEIPDGPKVT